jgi:hypothetical protein
MDIPNDANSQELERLIREIPVLVDRLQHEYNKFFTGAEKRPPLQLRGQLDKMAERAMSLQRQVQTASLGFRTSTAVSKYKTYVTMWDKKLQEREGTRR